jgi:hypothetical protein
VAVITHSLFKGKNGHKARVVGGRTRTITFIDEEIKETHVYDVDAADIHGARKRAIENAKAAGPNSVAADALDALTALGEFASGKEGKDTKKLSLEALGNDNALQWFSTSTTQRATQTRPCPPCSASAERWPRATHSSPGSTLAAVWRHAT